MLYILPLYAVDAHQDFYMRIAMRISAYADHPHEPHGSATAWPTLLLTRLPFQVPVGLFEPTDTYASELLGHLMAGWGVMAARWVLLGKQCAHSSPISASQIPFFPNHATSYKQNNAIGAGGSTAKLFPDSREYDKSYILYLSYISKSRQQKNIVQQCDTVSSPMLSNFTPFHSC